MKLTHIFPALLFGLVVSTPTLAAPCDKWEYARLKDSNKQELELKYCRDKLAWEANVDINKINSSAMADQLACSKEMDLTASMLLKKYKQKAPPKLCAK